jgi:hypothetical protein
MIEFVKTITGYFQSHEIILNGRCNLMLEYINYYSIGVLNPNFAKTTNHSIMKKSLGKYKQSSAFTTLFSAKALWHLIWHLKDYPSSYHGV